MHGQVTPCPPSQIASGLPSGYALSGAGIAAPQEVVVASSPPPRRRRAAAAIRRLRRKASKAFTAAVVLAVLAIVVPAVVDVRNADRAAKATMRATVCAGACDDRRDALARGRAVAPELTERIRRCEQAAGW